MNEEIWVVIRERSKPGIYFPPENWEIESVIAAFDSESAARAYVDRYHAVQEGKPWDGGDFAVVNYHGPCPLNDPRAPIPVMKPREQEEVAS